MDRFHIPSSDIQVDENPHKHISTRPKQQKYSSFDQTKGYKAQGIKVQNKTQQRQQEQPYK
jgi:hypothetical protein